MKHFKNDPHVLKHWQKQLISMMIVVKHYKTDLLLWNTDKTTCTLENTTENGSLSSVWHYRVVLEISRDDDYNICQASLQRPRGSGRGKLKRGIGG